MKKSMGPQQEEAKNEFDHKGKAEQDRLEARTGSVSLKRNSIAKGKKKFKCWIIKYIFFIIKNLTETGFWYNPTNMNNLIICLQRIVKFFETNVAFGIFIDFEKNKVPKSGLD